MTDGDASFRLPPAAAPSWCVAAILGSTYAPVNLPFLLAGHGIVESSNRGAGCRSPPSDPPPLSRFPRLSVKTSTCGLGEVLGVGPASCVVRGAAFQLLVVVGFTYSPVNPLLLLTGHGIVVSSRRVDRCGSSSSDPLCLFRFPRFSIEVSTCCLKEVPGVGLWGTLSLFRLLWLCHTSSVDPVWVWGL